MNQKKTDPNEVYKEDQIVPIWLEYGHEPDLKEFQISARDVK